ncbi:MAG: di-trans,poly-cis-decaprenylcistransferase [Candidatus Adiutrix sp.]|jgi:undecaprenyl diphosphate synthase|nr:di-trans,poly-cis-decaprenylcistransferase [Candidatus Adiutrix sp.]
MPETDVPRHIAIIMDGNGRWAARRGLSRGRGHQAGAEPVRVVLKAARRAGVRYLTLYAFSTENRGRPRDEVRGLFELLVQYLQAEGPDLMAAGVRLQAIGDTESLPEFARRALAAARELTAGNRDLTLTLALAYGSRVELTRAAQALAAAAAAGRLDPADITADRLAAELWTADLPDPDLLIRTGGDMRLSNFLLWQCAYTEFYFTPTLWPDFGAEDFNAALAAYAVRERRYGL